MARKPIPQETWPVAEPGSNYRPYKPAQSIGWYVKPGLVILITLACAAALFWVLTSPALHSSPEISDVTSTAEPTPVSQTSVTQVPTGAAPDSQTTASIPPVSESAPMPTRQNLPEPTLSATAVQPAPPQPEPVPDLSLQSTHGVDVLINGRIYTCYGQAQHLACDLK